MPVGPQKVAVRPPRVRADPGEITNRIVQQPDFQQLREDAGITEAQGCGLVAMLAEAQKAKSGEVEYKSSDIKKALKDLGLSEQVAKRLMCKRLVNTQEQNAFNLNFDQNDNVYFRKLPNGHLDANGNGRISNVMIKPDGLNEILQGGTDAQSMAIRVFMRGTFQLVLNELDRLQRFEQKHRTKERNRLKSTQALKTALMQVDPTITTPLAAQGVVRSFARTKYAALKIANGTPGFESPARSLATVASPVQLARRRDTSVSDNLTAVGKACDECLTASAAADLIAVQDQIAAEPTPAGKKRIRNDALSARPKRLAYFNIFAANVADIGDPNAVIDPRAQAERYLDQRTELEYFN